MQKIKLEITDIYEEIEKFYEPKKWHFVTLNALAINDKEVELQWIFSAYKDAQLIVFFATCGYETNVASIESLIPSATIAQKEVVDMFGIKIEQTPKGLYLDDDSLAHPLRITKEQ